MKLKPAEMMEISEKETSVIIRVKVQPHAGRSRVVGIQDGALKVQLAAPAVEGQANEECLRFLSKFFGVRRSEVEIIAGERSRRKLISLQGMSKRQVLERIEATVSR